MRSPRRCGSPAGVHGFTLVELLAGVLVGLVATLAVTRVLVMVESHRRTTGANAEAQLHGALALDKVARAVQAAGYGFGAAPETLGCAIVRSFGALPFNPAADPKTGVAGPSNGTSAAFPTHLVPVAIRPGTDGRPDTLGIFGSGKHGHAAPLRVALPGGTAASFPLSATLGVEGPVTASDGTPVSSGDLLAAAIPGSATCDLFQATAAPSATEVPRGNSSGWNAGALAHNYAEGHVVVNLGAVPLHRVFSIDVAAGSLRQNALLLDAATGAPSYTGANELFPGIVMLKAQYGKDSDGDGAADAWDNATPATNAGWRQVVAVRLAVATRSAQYERDVVTPTCPVWDGMALRVPGAGTCTQYPNAADEDWKHHRYRVFDTVVPLRNRLWNG